MSRRAALILGVLVVVSVGAYLYLQNLVYHPVVRLALPDGLSITAVLPATKERNACSTANERFVAPFKQCKECKIVAASCDHQLQPLELAMREGRAVSHPVVIAQELRIAVIGPPEAAKAGCKVIAADMVAKGMKSATCVTPQSPSPKS